MTQSNQPPNLTTELSRLKQRLDVVERRLNNGLGPGPFPEIVFSCAGLLSPSESEVWSSPIACKIASLLTQVREAGTSDTTLDVIKNGAVVKSIRLPAGTTSVPTPCSIIMSPNSDRLWMRLNSGGGASDISVSARY